MPKSFGTWLIIAGMMLLVVGVLVNTGVLSWLRVFTDHKQASRFLRLRVE